MTNVCEDRVGESSPAAPRPGRRERTVVVAATVAIAVAPLVTEQVSAAIARRSIMVVWVAAGALLLLRREHRRAGAAAPRRNAAGTVPALLAVYFGLLAVAGALISFGDSGFDHSAAAAVEVLALGTFAILGRELFRSLVVRAWGAGRGISGPAILLYLAGSGLTVVRVAASGVDPLDIVLRLVAPGLAVSAVLTILVKRGGVTASVGFALPVFLYQSFSPTVPAVPAGVTACIAVLTAVCAHRWLEVDPERVRAEPAARGASDFSYVIASFTMLLAVFFTIGLFGWRGSVVYGVSMEPGWHRGDVAITRPVDPSSLEVGDVIAFRAGSARVVHRIVAIETTPDGLVFRTQGDNNPSEDPPVEASAVDGEVATRIPGVGLPAIAFKTLLGEP